MRLLDKMLAQHVRTGELTIIDHKGRTRRYGVADPELKPVTVRLTDRTTPLRIARDPAVGTAEAFMDGRLVLDRGEILDLVLGGPQWARSIPAQREPARPATRPSQLAAPGATQRRPSL